MRTDSSISVEGYLLGWASEGGLWFVWWTTFRDQIYHDIFILKVSRYCNIWWWNRNYILFLQTITPQIIDEGIYYFLDWVVSPVSIQVQLIKWRITVPTALLIKCQWHRLLRVCLAYPHLGRDNKYWLSTETVDPLRPKGSLEPLHQWILYCYRKYHRPRRCPFHRSNILDKLSKA